MIKIPFLNFFEFPNSVYFAFELFLIKLCNQLIYLDSYKTHLLKNPGFGKFCD